MIDTFFGIHPHVIRSGLWANMRPGEKDLYVYLMEESERYRTRELRRTDAEIQAAVGTAPRTLCDARKRLAEHGLIVYRRGSGNKYTYVICDPLTRAPYPGDADKPVPYRKRSEEPSNGSNEPSVGGAASIGYCAEAVKQRPEAHGLPGVFDN